MTSNRSRAFLTFAMVIAICSACELNIFEQVAPETSDAALIEQARVEIDKKEFTKASATLEKVKADSNEKRLLQVSAKLGGVGFGIWSLILELTEGSDFKTAGSQGFDYIFNTFSEALLGTGEDRVAKLDSFADSVELLQSSPQPDEAGVSTLRCFLAGLMVYPTISDSASLLDQANEDLNEIVETAENGGQTADDCPDLELLTTTMDTVLRVQSNLDTIMTAMEGCSFLDISAEQEQLNEVEKKIDSLTSNADKGCVETPSCGSSPACDALQMGCVQQVVSDSDSIAGDGLVSSCELLQNCVTTDCFAE